MQCAAAALVDIAELMSVEVPTLSLMEALLRSRADALSGISEDGAPVRLYKRPRL